MQTKTKYPLPYLSPEWQKEKQKLTNFGEDEPHAESLHNLCRPSAPETTRQRRLEPAKQRSPSGVCAPQRACKSSVISALPSHQNQDKSRVPVENIDWCMCTPETRTMKVNEHCHRGPARWMSPEGEQSQPDTKVHAVWLQLPQVKTHKHWPTVTEVWTVVALGEWGPDREGPDGDFWGVAWPSRDQRVSVLPLYTLVTTSSAQPLLPASWADAPLPTAALLCAPRAPLHSSWPEDWGTLF